MHDLVIRSGLGDQLGFVLRHAYTAVWGDLVDTLAPLDLKPQTYATLVLVATDPGCKQQDIADALGIQRPNMVALIDTMIARGWLERAVNAADRRSYALSLTEIGSRLLSQARTAHRAHEARLGALLNPVCAHAFRDAARKLALLET